VVRPLSDFRLESDGFELRRALLNSEELDELEGLLTSSEAAGSRIFGNVALEAWLIDGPTSRPIQSILGQSARPVRAILFDKTPAMNWALGWHQDRTIAVRAAASEEGFDHWTIKAGMAHVEPPFSIIDRMISARIHLDPVDESNAPLLVSPGSHRLGRIAEEDLQHVIESHGTFVCLAERGDVWLYRTAIVHASERSRGHASRRVLQIDFSADDLPGRLEWLGIA
jgi:hypothetical protein